MIDNHKPVSFYPLNYYLFTITYSLSLIHYHLFRGRAFIALFGGAFRHALDSLLRIRMR